MISGYCQCNLDIMGCGFRWENPVTSFKYLHIDSRRQISETSSNGTKSTCYLQFADTVFKYGKSNPSLPCPLNNVVPLIKLPQETIGWKGGEGSGRFFFFFFQNSTNSWQFSHKVCRQFEPFSCFSRQTQKRMKAREILKMFIWLRSVTFEIRNQTLASRKTTN